MANAKLTSLSLGVFLAAGCQLMVDPDPKEIGQGGALSSSCKGVECESGAHCELVQVACVKAPCEPVAQCVSDDGGAGQPGDGDAGPSCAATTCPEGTDCVEGAHGAECKKPQTASCAATLCAADTYCDDISGQAKCLPLPSCKDIECAAGTHCELGQVQCFRAPCPPQPSCLPDPDPCAKADCAGGCKVVLGKAQCTSECTNPCLTVKCAKGTRCEARDVQCIKAPCCPVAECVVSGGAGEKCGDNTCSAGTYCCNESCGVCAPKGGACTQQICSRVN